MTIYHEQLTSIVCSQSDYILPKKCHNQVLLQLLFKLLQIFMSQESILIKNQKILDFTFAYQTDKWYLMICWLHLTDYTFNKTFPIGFMHVLACFCSMYSCDQQALTTCGVRSTKNPNNDSIKGLEFIPYMSLPVSSDYNSFDQTTEYMYM